MAAPKNIVPEENNRPGKSRHKKQKAIGSAPSSPVVESKNSSRKLDWVILIVLTFWTIYIRLWRLSQPEAVAFDEVHFGGFASKYIKKSFFMDVHPPLAKILITWASQVAGFDGQFDFQKIGKDYLQAKVPYVQIRAFCALHGVMVVPIAYCTLRTFGLSISTCVLTALAICYENGLITNNRLILLDSILLNFTAFTLLMYARFYRQQKALDASWWFWLTMTGIGLGLTMSSKWVGLFTVASIGLSAVAKLWDLWGDSRVTNHDFVKHLMARIICLVLLPCIIYMATFKIHFDMLPLTGSGTSFMSPEFQASMKKTLFPKTTLIDVVYGSKVDLRHLGTTGGYLHSHLHDYPGGSKQQQVTLYSHVDSNNWWIITKADTDEIDGLEYVKHGDIVRLKHLKTHKRLHTHNVRPMTNDQKYQFEVSAYGYEGFKGDANDRWRVEIMDYQGQDPNAARRLRTRRSRFRLISVTQHCALFSREHALPDWGYNQQEVTCMQEARLAKTAWMIENTETNLLPEGSETVEYEPKGFFGKFLELNKVMWKINKELPSAHSYASRPKDWPGLKRGISFWTKGKLKLYLLGNPLVYWISSASVVAYASWKFLIFLLKKRRLSYGGLDAQHDQAAGLFFICWALHYFPFNLMDRQLFLHHYMPSLYMAILLTGVLFDYLTQTLPCRKRWAIVALCLSGLIYVYRIFIPITYAQPWTLEQCQAATWRSTWNFNCKRFQS
ncbi:glycosyltransferase family 39 protein [Choanephora cucurbitarum]|nr:glycosyltransferase family 39 protein [Choanephora cucurbitarum]